jgi:hypothetical protein
MGRSENYVINRSPESSKRGRYITVRGPSIKDVGIF